MRRFAYLLPLALSLGGCGGSSDEAGNFTVSFQLSRGGDPIACAEVPEVMEVEVRLTDATGRPVAGIPTSADCAAGVYTAGVPAGTYTLQVSARGLLSGDPSAVLFRASAEVTAPGAAEIVLAPQVAFLDLAWTFGEDELAPCGTEVDSVDVIVSTGAGQVGSFSDSFGCTDTPVRLDAPLDLREYTIAVTANSAEGFPLFTHTAERLLDRGLNAYTANLMPLGGQVFVDWDFVLDAMDMPIRACDADSVQVTEAQVTIENLEGGAVVSETIACTDRPRAFSAARFTQGRMLELKIEAMGRERFLATETFRMPAGDRVGDRLVLHAVGTATVGIAVETASCAAGQIDGVELKLVLEGETEPLVEQTAAAEDASATFEDLWYGTYEVQAALLTPQGPLCPRTEIHVLDGPSADWGALRF